MYGGYPVKKLIASVAGAALIAGVSTAAFAHHSFAMFDLSKKVEFTGKIAEVQWTNPHVWIMVDVPNQGASDVRWGVEFTSIVHLTRRGFKSSWFNVGDEVTFSVSPYVDGSPGGRFYWVKLPGEKYVCDNGAAQKVCEEHNK